MKCLFRHSFHLLCSRPHPYNCVCGYLSKLSLPEHKRNPPFGIFSLYICWTFVHSKAYFYEMGKTSRMRQRWMFLIIIIIILEYNHSLNIIIFCTYTTLVYAVAVRLPTICACNPSNNTLEKVAYKIQCSRMFNYIYISPRIIFCWTLYKCEDMQNKTCAVQSNKILMCFNICACFHVGSF